MRFVLVCLLVAALSSVAMAVEVRPVEIVDGEVFPHAMAVRIKAPWPHSGEFVMRAPETLGSNQGLLFIDHKLEHLKPITLPDKPLKWAEHADGTLSYRANLDRGILLGVKVTSDKDSVTFESDLTNHFDQNLTNVGNQYCLIVREVRDFQDPYAKRTFIRAGGKWLAMKDLPPGNPAGKDAKPFFIVTNTSDLPPVDKGTIDRSWFADMQADIPLIATVSKDGKRIIGLAFDNSYKIMINADLMCIHADPKFADIPIGKTEKIRGKMYFSEDGLDSILARFCKDFPEWQAEVAR